MMRKVDKLTQLVESRTPLNASKLGAKLGRKACAQVFQERGWRDQAETPLPADEVWSGALFVDVYRIVAHGRVQVWGGSRRVEAT